MEHALVSGTRKSDEKTRPGIKGWLRRVLIFGVVSALIAVAIFFFAYQRTEIPNANAAYQAQSTYVYYAGGKKRLGTFAQQNRESLPLSEIPDSMQDAAVAAEDRTFWTNKGLDPKGILRAAFSNAQGNATQGASTITQQYVKLLYLSQERTLKRKVKEAFLSLKIQQKQSKQEILQGYLNT
ncbi:MAG: penicillin-binding protein, partial [Myxococcaceae bacterium]